MFQLEKDVCSNLDLALSREWLETNGLGGFASSTIVGLNTRRYHGLLVAATKPPVGRLVLLSKLEETLFLDGQAFDLSANRYPGVVHPQGFRFLRQFRLDPFPVFTYQVEGIEFEKRVFMIHGENSTVVQYKMREGKSAIRMKECRLEIRPLIAFRDYHSTTHENGDIHPEVEQYSGLARVTPYTGLPSLYIAHNASEVNVAGDWYRHFEYEVERERGLDFIEDLFHPFSLKFDLKQTPRCSVIASTERHDIADVDAWQESEILRRREVVKSAPLEDEFAKSLATAADQFIVARGQEKTVIAGYHWFSDWGRDTMISLPGLTLLTGRGEIARSILRSFAQNVDQGMLPNRFPDQGETPEYNTVDATLWFFEAVRQYLNYTGDVEFLRAEVYAVLVEIISWHVRGTRYGIKVDDDGLITSGAQGVQLTWMDAKVGDWVVTPRRGKPVEIQALWYNALGIMEDLAVRFSSEAEAATYGKMAAVARSSFNRLFWNEQSGCLYDVIEGENQDSSIRPNQIFAVSLEHTMLSEKHARAVVEKVRDLLLTPYGLRTLAQTDPNYRGRYGGNQFERDGAYHQGTVWPWLMGPFITAYVKVNANSVAAREQAGDWLASLKGHFLDGAVGQISEVFGGDPPYRPGGCVAQAWSVAELLRSYVEDIHGVKPTAPIAGEPMESQ